MFGTWVAVDRRANLLLKPHGLGYRFQHDWG